MTTKNADFVKTPNKNILVHKHLKDSMYKECIRKIVDKYKEINDFEDVLQRQQNIVRAA